MSRILKLSQKRKTAYLTFDPGEPKRRAVIVYSMQRGMTVAETLRGVLDSWLVAENIMPPNEDQQEGAAC
jgi:hypothetical protein